MCGREEVNQSTGFIDTSNQYTVMKATNDGSKEGSK